MQAADQETDTPGRQNLRQQEYWDVCQRVVIRGVMGHGHIELTAPCQPGVGVVPVVVAKIPVGIVAPKNDEQAKQGHEDPGQGPRQWPESPRPRRYKVIQSVTPQRRTPGVPGLTSPPSNLA